MSRLFIAIPIDELVVQRLSEVTGTDRTTWRWVKPEALHLTLAFLGEIPEALIPRAFEAMRQAGAAAEPLTLGADALGGFPNERRAHVLWAGVTGEVEALADLQTSLSARLEEKGLELEDRRYQPHITLARSREPGPLPAGLDKGKRFGRWRVTEIQLIESHPGAGGPRYEVRGSAPLGMTLPGT